MSARTPPLCTCLGLPASAFEQACVAGAHNVKTCFQHVGHLPQCGDCAPRVRNLLALHWGQQCNGGAAAPHQPPRHLD